VKTDARPSIDNAQPLNGLQREIPGQYERPDCGYRRNICEVQNIIPGTDAVQLIDVLWFARHADTDPVDFVLPTILPGARWHLAVDTSRKSPQDLFAAGEEPLWEDLQTYQLKPRSSVLLLTRETDYGSLQAVLAESK
jgi:hypothetical protein